MMIFQSSSKGNIYTFIGMNWTNGWNPPERIRLRKLSRKRTKPCSLPIAVNLTLKLVMMEKTDETIPSREELAVYIEEAAVSVTNNYEEAPAVLMVDDAVIGTLGNFSASIGKAKSKKTFNVSAIAASAIEWPHCSSLPVPCSPRTRGRFCISTRSTGRHHCQQVLKRILRLAEMPDDKVPENLIMPVSAQVCTKSASVDSRRSYRHHT